MGFHLNFHRVLQGTVRLVAPQYACYRDGWVGVKNFVRLLNA